MKYIDADRLKEEIERMRKINRKAFEADHIVSDVFHGRTQAINHLSEFIDSLQQEQSEVDLEKFTEKMEDWKARFNRPESIPIKATMAFTARMFYMYPNVARTWYDSLPKATQD